MPKAAIIVPVYNTPIHMLKRCLDSIKNQSMEDFECIVVDDGSTGSMQKFLKRELENDSRFKPIQIQHSGLSTARNIGMDNADSGIVFHVDSDDAVNPEMVQKVVDFINENDLEMAFYDASVEIGNANSSRLAAEMRYFDRRHSYGILNGEQMYIRMRERNEMIYSSFLCAMKKDAIKTRFYPRMRAQDELHTTLNLLQAERVGHLNERLYVKKSRKGSVSSKSLDAAYYWSQILTALELCRFIDTHSLGFYVLKWLDATLKEKHSAIASSIRMGIALDGEWTKRLNTRELKVVDIAFRRGEYEDRPLYADMKTLYNECLNEIDIASSL